MKRRDFILAAMLGGLAGFLGVRVKTDRGTVPVQGDLSLGEPPFLRLKYSEDEIRRMLESGYVYEGERESPRL